MSGTVESEPDCYRLMGTHSGFIFLVSCVFVLVFGVTLNGLVVDFAKEHEGRHLLQYIGAIVPGLNTKSLLVSQLTVANQSFSRSRIIW